MIIPTSNICSAISYKIIQWGSLLGCNVTYGNHTGGKIVGASSSYLKIVFSPKINDKIDTFLSRDFSKHFSSVEVDDDTGRLILEKLQEISYAKNQEQVERYRKAAEQGNLEAQFHLGRAHEEGHGVPQDYKQAVVWYRKAAEQGNPEAQFHLGQMYANGYGVSQDYKEAVKWYLKSEEEKLWVGYCQNLLVVYDPSMDISENKIIYMFLVEDSEMKCFRREECRETARVEKDEEKLSESIEKYILWKNKYGETFREDVERKEEEQRKIVAKHKLYLEKLGVSYQGFTENASRKNRFTRCYHCKNKIDSIFNMECKKCGWLICECGACGCGYG